MSDDHQGAGPFGDASGAAGAMGDMGALLGQAMEMQQQMLRAQEEIAQREVEGAAGGGMVRIVLTGGGELRRVAIDPEVVDPAEVEMLQDLVVAAFRDAQARAEELRDSLLAGPAGVDPVQMLEGLGSLDLGGLLGGGGAGAGGGGLPPGLAGAAGAGAAGAGADDEDGPLAGEAGAPADGDDTPR